MNSNIFNIQQEYLELIDIIDANDGELTPEIEEMLAINEENRDAKMEAYINVIRQKQSDNNLAKDEIERLRSIINRNDNAVSRLKNTLMQALEAFDLRGKTGNLSHRLPNGLLYTRNFESINILKEELSVEEWDIFKDLLDFSIKTKLTKSQVDKIIPILLEDNETHYEPEIVPIPSKTKFKDTLNNVYAIESEEEREKELARLEEFATIESKPSLIIR